MTDRIESSSSLQTITLLVQVSHTTSYLTTPPQALSPTVRVGWQGSQVNNSWLRCLVDYKQINHFTLVRSAHRIGPGICHPPQSSSREIPSKPQQEFENDDEENLKFYDCSELETISNTVVAEQVNTIHNTPQSRQRSNSNFANLNI